MKNEVLPKLQEAGFEPSPFNFLSSPRLSNVKNSRSNSKRLPSGLNQLVIPSLTDSPKQKPSIRIASTQRTSTMYKSQPVNISPKVQTNRDQTIKIFKQKIKVERKEDLNLFYRSQKNFENPIKIGDSPNTVKFIVEKSKKDHQHRKKGPLKGSMYVNDLWAYNFEKDIMKQAGIERELYKRARAEEFARDKQIRLIGMSPFSVENTPYEAIIENLLAQSNSKSKYYLSSSNQKANTEKSEEDYSDNYINGGYLRSEENSPQLPFSTRNFSQPKLSFRQAEQVSSPRSHRVTTSKNHKIQINIDGLDLGRNNSTRGLSDKYGPLYSTRTISTISQTNESSPKSRPKLVKRENMGGGESRQVQNNYYEHEEKEENNGEDDNRNPNKLNYIKLQRMKTIEMKEFLDSTSQQFHQLLGHCDSELKDKPELLDKIRGLEDLFLVPNFDKKKKREVFQRQKTMTDCKLMLDRKGQKRFLRQRTIDGKTLAKINTCLKEDFVTFNNENLTSYS